MKKKDHIKRILALLLAFMVAASVSGCGGDALSIAGQKSNDKSDPAEKSTKPKEVSKDTPAVLGDTNTIISKLKTKPDGKLKIAYLVDGLSNESSQRHWNQVQNECKMRGWELISDTNVSANYEADPTRNAFMNMMNQNPDAIVISYLDIPPIVDLCVEANNKGIGVYCIGTDISDGIVLNVLSENTVIGAKMMSYAMQRLNGSANTIGFMDLWMTRGIRRDAIAASIAEDTGYDVGVTIHHNITPAGYTDEMYNTATNWLTKYGSDIDFIWACWDTGAITIAQAMAAAGYTADDMFTVGMDGGTQAWAYIRNEEIPFVASLAEPFEYQVHIAFEAISQLQIEGLKPGDKKCLVPMSRSYSTDSMTVIIDKANVPEVGASIHSVFNFYGADPDDTSAWYNQGSIYKVGESSD